MNSKYTIPVGVGIVVVLIALGGFFNWISGVQEREKTPELQETEGAAPTDIVPGLVESDPGIGGSGSGGSISSIRGLGSPISGSVTTWGPDREGANLLEALCSYIGWSEKVHGALFFETREELDNVKSALEEKGWIFKEEKSPRPTLHTPILAGSHQERGYRIYMGHFK
jgi:hypothetical protein